MGGVTSLLARRYRIYVGTYTLNFEIEVILHRWFFLDRVVITKLPKNSRILMSICQKHALLIFGAPGSIEREQFEIIRKYEPHVFFGVALRLFQSLVYDMMALWGLLCTAPVDGTYLKWQVRRWWWLAASGWRHVIRCWKCHGQHVLGSLPRTWGGSDKRLSETGAPTYCPRPKSHTS